MSSNNEWKPGMDTGLVIINEQYQQKVFRVLMNQQTNKHLKTIVQKAGLNRNLTFHLA